MSNDPKNTLSSGHPDSKTLAEEIVDTVREPMLVLEQDLRVRQANASFYRHFQVQPEETVGQLVYDLGNGQWSIPRLRELLEKVLPEYKSFNDFEVQYTFEHIGKRTLLLNARHIEDRQLILLAMEDITGRKQREMEIERLNAELGARAVELEDANRELEAFNYSVAHDLRKPLTVVNGYCQAIRELCGDKLGEQCAGYLREAYEGTLRMNQLIEALLEFARLARVQPQRERVDLSFLAQAVAAELQLSEPQRRVTFRVADGVMVDGDANLLRVVLDNLLGNAWKYTGNREEALIEFGVAAEIDGELICFVRDNGTGFDMAYMDKLFVPFQRLPGVEEFRGFGIGLPTVERIIHRHGGRIWAEGEVGKGASFYFTLPFNDDKP